MISKIESEVESDIESLFISHSNLKHLAILSLLLFLAFLSYKGTLSAVFDYFINDHVFQVDRDYLAESGEKSEKTLEVISGLKSILGLIQSSEGGVSFVIDVNVQLGKLFNVVTELIDISWTISLVSILSILVQEQLLAFSKIWMAPIVTLFFMLFGLSYGLSAFSSRIGVLLRKLAETGLLLVFVIHLVVPLSIYLTASVSDAFFGDDKSEIHDNYQAISDNLSQLNASASLHEQVKQTITVFSDSRKSVNKDSQSYATLMIKHVVISIVEYVLTPLLLMVSLYFLMRFSLNMVWHHND